MEVNFCKKCDNMLFIYSNEENNSLYLACKKLFLKILKFLLIVFINVIFISQCKCMNSYYGNLI